MTARDVARYIIARAVRDLFDGRINLDTLQEISRRAIASQNTGAQ